MHNKVLHLNAFQRKPLGAATENCGWKGVEGVVPVVYLPLDDQKAVPKNRINEPANISCGGRPKAGATELNVGAACAPPMWS